MDKPKILIVEDEPFYSSVLVEWLTPEYDTVIAGDGQDAIQRSTEKPDLILLDVMMPGMDGYEVCRRIKTNIVTLDIPIIFLTVKSDIDDEIRGFEVGAADYISKPISPPILRARVKTHLALKKARDAALNEARELRSVLQQKTRELTRKAEERQNAMEQFHYLANYDPLTQLPNRLLFKEQLATICGQALINKLAVGVLLIGLDNFKRINDSLGHTLGDELLRQVAPVLQNCIRKADSLARLGGDEFVVALADITQKSDAEFVAKNILRALSEPFDLDHQNIHISASIGIAIFPQDSDDLEKLLQNADVALYQAKTNGKASFEYFTPDLIESVQKHLQLNEELRTAVKREQFELHYQPIVDLNSLRIAGAEALIRWMHPSRGLIPPLDFIPIAEESELISDIGNWVLNTATHQARVWTEIAPLGFYIAINISARQFATKTDLINKIARAIEKSDINGNQLRIEITESLMMHDVVNSIDQLNEIKAMGIGISVDDFGTGYSSLSTIRRFPVDTLKIDRSFICELTPESDDAKLVMAILAMANALQLNVITEGVETEQQLNFLKSHGCPTAQGFYLSPPLSSDRFEDLLCNPKLIHQACHNQ